MTSTGSARVVNLDDYRETGRVGTDPSRLGQLKQTEVSGSSTERELGFADLYPELDNTSPQLSRMHELLSEALKYAVRAHEAITGQGDLLTADEELGRVAAI